MAPDESSRNLHQKAIRNPLIRNGRLWQIMTDNVDNLCSFKADMTLRWPCRRGDFFIWFGWKGLFSMFEDDPSKAVLIRDMWEMRDGDHVTITNRYEDIPEWFALHPLEVCNRLMRPMKKLLDNGYDPPDPLEGANIWRIKAGDRLAWVGKPRPGLPQQGPILSLIDFRETALVIGENAGGITMDNFYTFGGLTKDQQNPEEITMVREAIKSVLQLGMPRTFTPEWKLG
jgi:hypothetical protein